jgi:hypothetical protein
MAGPHHWRLHLGSLLFGVLVATAALAQHTLAAKSAFPDIVAVTVQPRAGGTLDFDVTVSSPYETAQQYADAFRVLSTDGTVLGERILLHDHITEQPFTRELHGVRIPPGVAAVTVQGRDTLNGYGGKTRLVVIPGR